MKRLGLQGNHTVAIFGQGPVGLSATQLAATMGARVIALDISDERLQKERELGADVLINVGQVDSVIEAIREQTGGLGADERSRHLVRRRRAVSLFSAFSLGERSALSVRAAS